MLCGKQGKRSPTLSLYFFCVRLHSSMKGPLVQAEWEHHVRAGWSQLRAIVLLGCRTYLTMGWCQHTWGLYKSESSGLRWSFHVSSQMSSHSWSHTGQHIFLYFCDFQSTFHSKIGMCCWYSLMGSPRTFPLIKLLLQIQDIRSKETVNLPVLLFFIGFVCVGGSGGGGCLFVVFWWVFLWSHKEGQCSERCPSLWQRVALDNP